MDILKGELSGQFSLDTTRLRPFVSSGKIVQLGDSKGMIFQPVKKKMQDSDGLDTTFSGSNVRLQNAGAG